MFNKLFELQQTVWTCQINTLDMFNKSPEWANKSSKCLGRPLDMSKESSGHVHKVF